MRIAFLCSEYPPGPHGGIGTMTQLLARGLVERGHAVRVLGLDWDDGRRGAAAPRDEEDRGVRVHRLPPSRGPLAWARDRVRLWRAVARWARAGAIDVVETADWGGPAAGWPRLPVPVVVRANGSATYMATENGARPDRLTRLLERRALRRADAWCAVSAFTAGRTRDVVPGLGPADDVIHNGVVLPPLDDAPRWPTSVVFSGTLTEKKGIVALVDAWPAVLAQHPHAMLDVYGKNGRAACGGAMRDVLVARLGPAARARVRFHGHVERAVLLRALRRAAVAVFPSFVEAFAFAPLEAMACGCATVGSTRGSGPEMIRDGEDGFLVDPAAPATIAAALDRLLADPALAARLGEAGRRRVETRFSVDHMADRSVEFYERAVRRAAAPRTASTAPAPEAADAPVG